jgi:rubrerythrin
MKEIMEYLLKIEKTAGDIYKDASVFFKHDKEFARFLSLLAEDEADHFDAIVSAEEYFVGNADKFPAFTSFNSTTKQKIERPFIEARGKQLSWDLTKDAMIGNYPPHGGKESLS